MSNTTTTSPPIETTTPGGSTPTTTAPGTTPPATTVQPTTSIISLPPSTVTVAPTTTTLPPTTIVQTITQTPSSNPNQGPTVITITSTADVVTETPTAGDASTRTGTSSSRSPTALSAGGGGNSSGLTTGATIAIAVIIPIIVVALGVLLGVFLWRKRKQKKIAEEQRKNEMAEYGYNPNNDPTLPAVGAAYTGNTSDNADDAGYRGWGTTSSNTRKPSTTMGSNSRQAALAGIGVAVSDSNSQPGGYTYQNQYSPNPQELDGYSHDQATNGHPERHDGVGALGGASAGLAAGAAARNRNSTAGIQRGPSNASSAYSNGRAQSDSSGEIPSMPNSGNYYQDDVPYNIYHDVQPGHGPYGDGTYSGGEQPVIRDVAARRNTKIERAPTFPQTQGGIAQNF